MSFALYYLLFGILVVCPEIDGNLLMWNEPLPILTVQESDAGSVFHRNRTRLIEGTINASLSWYFNLSSRLRFDSVNLKLETVVIAVVDSQKQEVSGGFKHKYAINWIPNQRITLEIFSVTTEQNATFACEVVARDSIISIWRSLVQVDIIAPPSNIIMSSDQTIKAPAELTLNCSADGKPTPTITWTRLSDNTNVSMPVSITGGKNEEKYRCTADNGVGKPLTKVVNITVLYKPVDVSLNIPTKVCAGTAVTLTCSARAANPLVQGYVLYKFVAGVRNSSSNQVGVFNQTLLIEGPHNYICEASNSEGETSSHNRTVEVQVPGSITIAESKIPVLEGANVSVHCNFSGFHSQHVSWINAANYTVGAGTNLKFPSISRQENGEYSCSASNMCGGDSKRVFIDVQYPVEVTRKGQNYSVLKGTSKTLTCPVAGNPEPNITWYDSSGAPISTEEELKAGNNGCYICIANNSISTPVNITQCLIVKTGKQISGQLTIGANFMEEYKDLNSASSILFVAEFVGEMNRRCVHFSWYIGAKVTNLSRGSGFALSRESVIVEFILYIKTAKTKEHGLEQLKAAIYANGTFGRYKAGDLVLLSEESTTSTTPGRPKPTVSADPRWAIVGAVAGGVLLLAIIVGVLTWWVHKQRKCRKDTKSKDQTLFVTHKKAANGHVGDKLSTRYYWVAIHGNPVKKCVGFLRFFFLCRKMEKLRNRILPVSPW